SRHRTRPRYLGAGAGESERSLNASARSINNVACLIRVRTGGNMPPERNPFDKRQTAIAFLNQVIIGRISEAFEKYISRQGFRHHNFYFRGDRESLKKAMMEANQKFP